MVRRQLPATVELLVGGGGATAIQEELGRAGVRIVGDLPSLRSSLRESAAGTGRTREARARTAGGGR